MTTNTISLLAQRVAVLEATMLSEHETRIACLNERKQKEEHIAANLALFASARTVACLGREVTESNREVWSAVAKLQVATAINKTNLVILMGAGSFIGCSIGALVISLIFKR